MRSRTCEETIDPVVVFSPSQWRRRSLAPTGRQTSCVMQEPLQALAIASVRRLAGAPKYLNMDVSLFLARGPIYFHCNIRLSSRSLPYGAHINRSKARQNLHQQRPLRRCARSVRGLRLRRAESPKRKHQPAETFLARPPAARACSKGAKSQLPCPKRKYHRALLLVWPFRVVSIFPRPVQGRSKCGTGRMPWISTVIRPGRALPQPELHSRATGPPAGTSAPHSDRPWTLAAQ